MLIFVFTAALTISVASCHQQPHVSVAASSSALTAPAPMGSETSQGELKNRHAELLESSKFKALPKHEQQLSEAEFYFAERRFIESARLLSPLLDENPTYPRARNLLARCFFFLGNLGRALDELDYVVVNHAQDLGEVLDALYLQGAAVYGSDNVSDDHRRRAIKAWEMYLKVAHDSPHKEKVSQNLEHLKHPGARKLQKSTATSGSSAIDAFDAGDLLVAEKLFLERVNKKADPEGLTYLGRIYVRLQRMDESHAMLTKAVKIDSRYVAGWHYLGMANMMKQNTEGAVSAWQKVIELDPKYAQKHKLRDRILIAKGMGESY